MCVGGGFEALGGEKKKKGRHISSLLAEYKILALKKSVKGVLL